VNLQQDSSGEDNAWLNSEDEESFSEASDVSEDSIEVRDRPLLLQYCRQRCQTSERTLSGLAALHPRSMTGKGPHRWRPLLLDRPV